MKQTISSYVKFARIIAMSKLASVLLLASIGGLVYLALNLNSNASDQSLTEATEVVEEFNEEEYDKIENGIHVRTGLVDAEGLMTVVSNCTSCHSAKIIIQNRMTAERWNETIKWMQETQNLWDLGKNQEIIVNYLVANYPVKKKGRRMKLENIEWYELEN
ncbi:MAG: monoheme cytochrome C [Bacteroidia bacterium]|nr:monoheme cytochrome C [Bacteroidia bacterium]